MMGKGSFIAIVALLIAVAGAIVAFAAYFRKRNCVLCDDFDDGFEDDMSDLDYYSTPLDENEPLDDIDDSGYPEAILDKNLQPSDDEMPQE